MKSLIASVSHFKPLVHSQTGELKETSHFLPLPSWHGGKNEICMDSAEAHIHLWRTIMLTGALEAESLSTSCLAAPHFLRVSHRTCAMDPTLKGSFPQKQLNGLKGQIGQSRQQSPDCWKTLKTFKKTLFFARLWWLQRFQRLVSTETRKTRKVLALVWKRPLDRRKGKDKWEFLVFACGPAGWWDQTSSTWGGSALRQRLPSPGWTDLLKRTPQSSSGFHVSSKAKSSTYKLKKRISDSEKGGRNSWAD